MDEAELNAIRQARLKEMQQNALGSVSGTGGSSAGDHQVLAQLLEPEARERLSRVRMVRPERAQQVEQYIVRLAQMGQIQRKLTEKNVVEILDGIARDSKSKGSGVGEIVYNRKATAADDDDDDDFFDWTCYFRNQYAARGFRRR